VTVGARTDLEVGPLIAEATRRLLADGVTPRTPTEIKAETGALAVLQINQRAALQSEEPEKAAALGVQISAAEEAQTTAVAADAEVERKLEAHVAKLMLERSYQLGPTDLAYLDDRFDGEVDVAADELKKKMPEDRSMALSSCTKNPCRSRSKNGSKPRSHGGSAAPRWRASACSRWWPRWFRRLPALRRRRRTRAARRRRPRRHRNFRGCGCCLDRYHHRPHRRGDA